MKIIIPGGSGQVGVVLARKFQADGYEVVVLSRNPKPAPWKTVTWDAETLGDWTSEIDGADVVINLAGRTVNCRYNAKNRAQMMDSRVNSTRVVGHAIAQSKSPPRLWLQASTATIYTDRYDAPNDEATGILGKDDSKWGFSIQIAKAWEAALEEADTPNTRKVALRSAMTMSPDRGGIFDVLSGLVRIGLGGKVWHGRQFVSWIHEADFLAAIDWIIEREEFAGPVNLASPNPLPYADFMRAMRKAWKMPIGLPAFRWMVKIGTFLMRTESELVLKSRRVVPQQLLASGFEFQYPDWPEAARELVARRQASRREK
jgi:uncharacterized protein (TIGR01777 family)